jgi:hypothetical protein
MYVLPAKFLLLLLLGFYTASIFGILITHMDFFQTNFYLQFSKAGSE